MARIRRTQRPFYALKQSTRSPRRNNQGSGDTRSDTHQSISSPSVPAPDGQNQPSQVATRNTSTTTTTENDTVMSSQPNANASIPPVTTK